MSSLRVPDLLKKLNLLIEYSEYSNLAEIADHLDKKLETVRSWTKGAGLDVVPSHRRDAFIDLFAAQLPMLSRDQLIETLQSPRVHLEQAFITQKMPSLRALIEAQARFDRGKLVLAPNGLDLVEIRRDQAATELRVPLGQYFRLEFETPHHGSQVIGLQHAPQGWAVLAASFDATRKTIHLPSLEADGSPNFMRERNDLGVNRFIAIQTLHPLPAVLHAALADRVVLNRFDLASLAEHLGSLGKTTRAIFALDIEFVQN